jgi:pilus assembly protein CpaB
MKRRRTNLFAILCGVVCTFCILAFMNSVRSDAEAARAEALERYRGEQVDARAGF